MIILVILALCGFAIQFILAFYASTSRKEIKERFAVPIGEQIRLSELIEKYWNEFKLQLSIRATDAISVPAFYFQNTVLVSRKHLLFTDLHTLYYFIFQTEIARRDFKAYTKMPQILNWLFLGELLVFIAGLLTTGDIQLVLLIGTIGLQIISTVTSLIYITLIKQLLFDSSVIATYMLSLDDVEQARLLGLVDNMKYYHMEYPFESLYRVMAFFRF
jgi:hypothetical protein